MSTFMEKKRIIGIVTTVIIVLLTISAHIVTNKHVSDTRDNYRRYNDSIAVLTRLVSGISGKTAPEQIAHMINTEPQAKAAIADIRGVLDYFEKLSVPNKMRSELDEVIAALPSEREFMNKLERVFASRTADELRQSATVAGNAAGLERNYESFDSSLERFIERMEDCAYPRHRGTFLWL